MGRRILNRKELRADFDAAERKTEGEEREEEEDEEGEEDEEDGDESEEGEEAEDGDEPSDEDDEEAPKKKKKVTKAKTTKPRSRAVKVVRMRAIWGVFDNSSKMIAKYDYPLRTEADAHATRLTTDKRSTHFVQMVKEPIEEKKDK